ncbi:hypothetical protein [Thalassomonas sp. RHCl1]|uniref:hypothetical protein n=1 Tax=Thalassomonas sp. RHCl1 TaxID=2995320 RepID=UPI00248B3464|nr:hypothetical protein [Thalassomonas sp. RHCl1]
MGNLNFLLGRSDFKAASDIIESVSTFPQFNERNENLALASSLLVFKSQSQQCWLIFTSQRIYFVVDDNEVSETKTLWARDREKIVKNGRIDLDMKIISQSKESSKLLFGKMNKGFLFTNSLFKDQTITGLILKLVSNHFLSVEN